jgi:hypothetical protein
LVIAAGDTSPVIAISEHVLDPLAVPVEGLVVGDRGLAAFSWRNAGRDPTIDQGLAVGAKEIARLAMFATEDTALDQS